MSPISITPINTSNLQTKYGKLSKYAQRFMKSQAKSMSFALGRFFSEVDTKLISQNEQKLKELGLKQIGKDISEGVVISDAKYDYHVFSTDKEYLNFDVLESGSNEVCRHFSISDKSNDYTHSGDYSGLNIEDEMSKVLDFVGDKLLKAKSEYTVKPEQPYIQEQATADKIAKLNKVMHGTQKNTDIQNSGFINPAEEELLESINGKLPIIQELYKNIKDCRTKWEVKKSYKNYLPQPVTNKLGFKNIGPNGESVSLFRTTYKNNAHTAIIITDVNGKETKFVISQDKKSVQKNLPNKFVKSDNSEYRICLTPDYYTQKEVDESNLHSYLTCLDKEMDNFIEHTQGWFKQKEETKLIKSNYNSATMDEYKDILDDIHTNFENYRTKMRKYLRKPHKNKKFKTENNISTKLTSTAVKFDNITPEGYDLRLSYPKVRNSHATQLLVMSDDKIENSFYILNNKLLRFDIKDLNDKFNHYDRNLYYYDNNYLQNSNLGSYLTLIQDKLHELNEKLDVIRKKQIENRIKYHIKPQKNKTDKIIQ